MSGSPARRRRRALGRLRDKIKGADALEAFDRMAVGTGAAEPPDGPNVYVCETCGGFTVTRHADPGVTPAFIACRAGSDGETLLCGERAASRFYPPPPLPRILADLPVWEWYRPDEIPPSNTAPRYADFNPGWGALALRGPFPPDWPAEMVAR